MLGAIIALCIVVAIFLLIYFTYEEKKEYNKQNSDYQPDGFRNIKDSSKNIKTSKTSLSNINISLPEFPNYVRILCMHPRSDAHARQRRPRRARARARALGRRRLAGDGHGCAGARRWR